MAKITFGEDAEWDETRLGSVKFFADGVSRSELVSVLLVSVVNFAD